MKKSYSYWIEYHTPGLIVGESYTVDCDVPPSWEDIRFPDNAYAATLWQREDVIDGAEVYRGQPERIGKQFYYHPDSRITTLEQLKNGDHGFEVGPALLSNMRCNRWDAVVWSRWGDWPQPYDPEDIEILPALPSEGSGDASDTL